ncbi:Pectinesterase inhibitor domain [Sesbania bispinosa]|nr:Pectinesterase inhibitor domain [Sesbania bispinosa]
MNSSTLSSLFFTLSLILLISHTPFPASGANLYEAVCKEAEKDSARCLQILKDEPRIASARTYDDLSKFILEFGLKRATEGQNYLKEVMKTNPTPAITQCATVHYDGVVGSFKSSLGELEEDVLTANYDAKVAGDGPTTCNSLLADEKINNPTISALNSDILLISKIAFLATNKLPIA